MRRAASLLTVALLAHTATDAQTARFTAEDMLKVVTASVQDMTEDGRLVAFTERRTYDNAETDNYRYGDPTYLGPSAVRLVVVDTQTGERKLPRRLQARRRRCPSWSGRRAEARPRR